MMRAVSPTGSPIKGTLERLTGVALIDEFSWGRNPKDEGADSLRLTFEHDGYTEVDWDSETTVKRRGFAVFVDEAGEEWTENNVTLVDADAVDSDEETAAHDADIAARHAAYHGGEA